MQHTYSPKATRLEVDRRLLTLQLEIPDPSLVKLGNCQISSSLYCKFQQISFLLTVGFTKDSMKIVNLFRTKERYELSPETQAIVNAKYQ